MKLGFLSAITSHCNSFLLDWCFVAMVAMLPPQAVHHQHRFREGGGGLSAGSLEELHRAQEVPAAAGLCRGHTEELEELLPPQNLGSSDSSNSLERIQREEPLLSDLQHCDEAADAGQRIPGSTQVN